jgi:hypothetical protein
LNNDGSLRCLLFSISGKKRTTYLRKSTPIQLSDPLTGEAEDTRNLGLSMLAPIIQAKAQGDHLYLSAREARSKH